MSFICPGGCSETMDWLDGIGSAEEQATLQRRLPGGKLPRDVDPEVFMLNVVARDPRVFAAKISCIFYWPAIFALAI